MEADSDVLGGQVRRMDGVEKEDLIIRLLQELNKTMARAVKLMELITGELKKK